MTARPRRGIALYEMMVAIALSGVAITLAAKLTKTAVDVTRRAAEGTRALQASEQWLDGMRRDVWSTRSAVVAADGTLVLELPGGSAQWRVAENALTRSDAAGRVRRWAAPPGLTWSIEGRVVRVRDARSDVVLSGRLLAGGTR